MAYVGRFAPSPSGPLHFGSLVSALGSFLQAKSQQGQWHVRIDDLDPPRVVQGAADVILNALEHYHLFWDGTVVYQSQQQAYYQETLENLLSHSFACQCSRKQLKHSPIYPGNCRSLNLPFDPYSIRYTVPDTVINLKDEILGKQQWQPQADCGDFIIRRADHVFAYSLATVIDDINIAVTEVIRGKDLLQETPKQLLLYQHLKQQPPTYGHLPLARNPQGQKLSKQHGATALPLGNKAAVQQLHHALVFLNQNPSPALLKASITEIMAWALSHWDIKKAANAA